MRDRSHARRCHHRVSRGARSGADRRRRSGCQCRCAASRVLGLMRHRRRRRGRRSGGTFRHRNRRCRRRHRPGAVECVHPAARGRDARLAQRMDVASRPRACCDRSSGRRRGNLRGPAPLCAGGGGWPRSAARRLGDRAVPLWHRCRWWSQRGLVDRRGCARPSRRCRHWCGALSGAGAHSDPATVYRHQLDGAAGGRRNGGTSRRISRASRPAAAAR